MYVLGGLYESFDNIFSIMTKKMISESVTIGDSKALLLSHKSRIERWHQENTYPLPSINLSIAKPIE